MTAKIKDGRPTTYDHSMIDGAKEYIGFFQLSEEAKAAQKDGRVNPTDQTTHCQKRLLFFQ